MKTATKFCLSLLVSGLLAACGTEERTQSQQAGSTQESAMPQDQDLCFLQVTTGRPTASAPGIVDSLIIRLRISGSEVTGTLNWLPAEKDRMTGTLQGTLQDSILTAIYTYTAEGITAKEERVFKLEPDTLRMKTGELEERQGIWVLTQKEQAPYAVAVPRVPCTGR